MKNKVELDWKDLLALPINSAFYEIDYPSTPIFIKTASCKGKYKNKDILVESLQPNEDCPCRLGFVDMDDAERNSKRYHLFSNEEINIMIGKLMLI